MSGKVRHRIEMLALYAEADQLLFGSFFTVDFGSVYQDH